MTTLAEQAQHAAEQVSWGDSLTDDQTEILADSSEPVQVGGDSDWRVAVYVYDLTEPVTGGGVTVPPGAYIRTVEGNRVMAFHVDDIRPARAYAAAVEAEWTGVPAELSPAQRAQRIADMVVQLAKERVDNEHPDDWTLQRTFDDYVYTVRSVEAWTEGPRHARVVVACPRMHPHGGHWTNIAAELLDAACDRVDTEAGVESDVEHWRIDQADGDYVVRLVPLVMHEPYDCGGCGATADADCVDPHEFEQCDGPYPARQACGECGAAPDEDCLPGCQGAWA